MIDPTSIHWMQQYSQINIVNAIWACCHSNHASIAIWQLPQSQTLHFLVDFSKQSNKARLHLHKSISGFAISPFINPDGAQTHLLEAGLYIRFRKDYELIHNDVPEGFWEKVKRQLESKQKKSPLYYLGYTDKTHSKIINEKSEDKAAFIQIIEQALNCIDSKVFDKVVLARSLTESLPASFNLIGLFNHISAIQTDAFVSLISTPEHGTWLGASPEILIKTMPNNSFHTCSLAGTQAYDANEELSDVSWNQKEIEEQAMVSRYIIEQFKSLRLREFIETGPMTVKAGELLHLKTHYDVDMQALSRPTIASEMLQLLHPTAAICGLPKKSAMQFIEQYEPLQRKLYSGYLGPVNINGATNLYVNLRCMQIQKNHLTLFAGCGITHYSNPEKEWLETTLKCNILRDLLHA